MDNSELLVFVNINLSKARFWGWKHKEVNAILIPFTIWIINIAHTMSIINQSIHMIYTTITLDTLGVFVVKSNQQDHIFQKTEQWIVQGSETLQVLFKTFKVLPTGTTEQALRVLYLGRVTTQCRKSSC